MASLHLMTVLSKQEVITPLSLLRWSENHRDIDSDELLECLFRTSFHFTFTREEIEGKQTHLHGAIQWTRFLEIPFTFRQRVTTISLVFSTNRRTEQYYLIYSTPREKWELDLNTLAWRILISLDQKELRNSTDIINKNYTHSAP